MQTQVIEREQVATPAISNGEVAVFKHPRLPYHDAINERYGVDRSGWKALVEAVYPNAKTVDSVVMVLSYCKARNLDPFKRVAHIVPMWSAAVGKMVETIWPGIAEARTTAFRTENFAGMEAPEFGPTLDRTFEGTATKGFSKGETRKVEIQYPEWCRITIVRELHGKERRFVGPKTYWVETYAKWADTDVPNDMWARRPSGQIEKCAEAAALRRAFPEEIGNEYFAEEMDGQRLIEAPAVAVEPPTPPEPPAIEAPKNEIPQGCSVEALAGGTLPSTGGDHEVINKANQNDAVSGVRDAVRTSEPPHPGTDALGGKPSADVIPPGLRRAANKKPNAPPAFDTDAWLKTLATECVGKTPSQLLELRERMVEPMRERLGHAGYCRAGDVMGVACEAAQKAAEPKFDADQWYRDLEGAISGCTTAAQIFEVQEKVQKPAIEKVSREHYTRGKKLVQAALMSMADED